MSPRRILLAFVLLSAASWTHAASILSDRDRAVVIAAEHVFSQTGTPALSEAVRSRRIRGEAYWKSVYAAAGKPALFDLIRADLLKAANDVPLIGGMPPPPDAYAKAIVFGLGAMPLRPIGMLPPGTRQRVVAFADQTLRPYCTEAMGGSVALSSGGERLAAAAQAAFGSKAAGDAFRALVDAAAVMGEPGADLDVIDAKDKLNEFLHLYGLHIVVDPTAFDRGHAGLKGYVVMSGFAYSIFNTPFSIYEARPLTPEPRAIALGHAETELGYLFIFGDLLDAEAESAAGFLTGKTRSSLWLAEKEIAGGLTTETAERIDARVRALVAPLVPRFRAALIDTIAHHEGFHRYVELSIVAAIRTGALPYGDAGRTHETGAYLYQIESSSGPMAHWDLLMALVTALNTSGGSPDNMEGARAALSGLQTEIPSIRFWDQRANLPIEPGIADLFDLPPDALRKAASSARWAFISRLGRPR